MYQFPTMYQLRHSQTDFVAESVALRGMHAASPTDAVSFPPLGVGGFRRSFRIGANRHVCSGIGHPRLQMRESVRLGLSVHGL